jgi:hypothetical protein
LVLTTRASAATAEEGGGGDETKGPVEEERGAATVAEGLEVRIHIDIDRSIYMI